MDPQESESVSRDLDPNEIKLDDPEEASSTVEIPQEDENASHAHENERERLQHLSAGVTEDQELPDDVKTEMLADICKGIVVLRRESDTPGGYCNVYLVGTAHVSQESCKEVQAVIRLLKPQVVYLELCEKRRFMLVATRFQVPTVKEMLGMLQEKRLNLLGIIYSWFLAKVATKVDVFPGSEFRVAYEEAKTYGAMVVLGDRDVQVTLRRTWAKMSIWHKVKFIFCMVFQAISLPSVEDLKEMIQGLQDVDMITLALQELSKSFPTLMETLVHERDMFMAGMLQKIAEHHSSIVAVVGKGHISGIAKNWNQDISVDTLMEDPRRKSLWNKSFKYFILGSLVVLPVAFAMHKFSQSR